MKYVQGYGVIITCDHPDDEGTSITVAGNHVVLLEGCRSAVITFEGQLERESLLATLDYPPPDMSAMYLELATPNYWLTVARDSRCYPLMKGILVSVGARPYTSDEGDTVSVFVENSDISRLRQAIDWGEDRRV